MKKVTIDVYTVDELQGKAKENALQKIKDSMIDINFDDFRFFANDELQYTYGLNATLSFDLNYCQGDGLRFVTDNLATDAIIDRLPFEKAFLDMLKALVKNDDLSVSTNDNGEFWRYSYSHARQVDVNFSVETQNSLLEATRQAIKKAFVDIYLSICKDLEKTGYECYEVTDEDAIEFANENENEYLENGQLL
jgi:hypothetical protein